MSSTVRAAVVTVAAYLRGLGTAMIRAVGAIVGGLVRRFDDEKDR